MTKLQKLQELSFFQSIDVQDLQRASTLFIEKNFAHNQRLWREGEPAQCFTFIVQGRVKVVKFRNDGKETVLRFFGEDESVGNLAVYRQIPYPASAFAVDDTCVLTINRAHFFGLLSSHPTLMEGLLNEVLQCNEELVGRLHELSLADAEQRLAMLFARLADTGRRVPTSDGHMGVHIDLPLSRSDLAECINVRVETAIRLMSKWDKSGLVRTESPGFTILDFPRLHSLASAS